LVRLILRTFFFAFISVTVFISCDSNTSVDPQEQYYPDYYPTSIGSTLKYSVIENDSAGNLVQSGTRNILFSGTTLYNGINYTTQDDSLDFGSQSNVSTYLVRKSETGVFYAVDTSQIALLIPDSLKQYVSLRDEMQLLFYPLTSGSSWSLYRVTAQVQPGIEIKILDIIASFVGTEQVDLNIDSVTVVFPSRKVKYTLELFTEIGSAPETYTAYMWYAASIGLIKYQGNQFIVSVGGGGITFLSSPNILTQELIEYNIE
jgi:hypothetical protein